MVACYEAGVSAYDLQRQITALAVPCQVMAPALTPRRPGQRISADRRDAGKLVHLFRSGELTPIHVPAEAGDAVRDLVRCRDDVRGDVLRWRVRLLKLLADHGLRNRSHFLRLAELAKEVFDDTECQCGTGHDKAPRGVAHQSLRPDSYRRAKPRHWKPGIARIAEGQIDDDRAHNNADSPFG